MNNSRIAELQALANEEGIRLPMPVDLICFFERHGYVVDLRTGEVCRVTVSLTPSAQAVCHLLASVSGDIAI